MQHASRPLHCSRCLDVVLRSPHERRGPDWPHAATKASKWRSEPFQASTPSHGSHAACGFGALIATAKSALLPSAFASVVVPLSRA
eukprot:6616805-Prymnesium_polylepis.2